MTENRIPQTLTARLHSETLLFDGAMGTVLLNALREPEAASLPCERLSVTAPALVQRVHEQYLRAGAQVIVTNTVCANRPNLAQYSLADSLEELIRAAVSIARRAITSSADGTDRYVAGSIGPILSRSPVLEGTPELYREPAEALLKSGVDCILLETFPSQQAALPAVSGVRQAAAETMIEVPLLLCFAPPSSISVITDSEWLDFIHRVIDLRVDAVGFNCGDGPASCIHALDRLAEVYSGPLLLRPSAGILDRTGSNLHNSAAVTDFVTSLKKAAQRHMLAGIGGCCGTTPAHIRKLRDRISSQAQPVTRQMKHARISYQR